MLLNTHKTEFLTTDYCVTLYKDFAYCMSHRSLGTLLIRGLEDLDLIPEQFQSRSSERRQLILSAGSFRLIYSQFIAGVVRVFSQCLVFHLEASESCSHSVLNLNWFGFSFVLVHLFSPIFSPL